MNGRRRSLPIVVLLLGLILAFNVQAPHASLNVIWRLAVLSFDNPATQLLDELALDTGVWSDPAAEAEDSARNAPGLSSRLRLESSPISATSPGLASGITRSPPLAS